LLWLWTFWPSSAKHTTRWKSSQYSETCEKQTFEMRTSCEIRTLHLVPNCCPQCKLPSEMRTPLNKGHFWLVPRVSLLHRFYCTVKYVNSILVKWGHPSQQGQKHLPLSNCFSQCEMHPKTRKPLK
jgi:hypothetical protein